MRILLLLFLGASIGSFLGVVIDRFPEESLFFPASHCNHCKHRLQIWDLIPILSQALMRSKCRYCKAKIPYWYALLEGISAVLVLLTYWQVISLLQFFLILGGIVLTIYDIKHQEYPVMVWLVFTFIVLLLSSLNWTFCGFIVLALLAEKYNLNIGSGDFFYLASLSLLFSFTEILWIVQIASILGILIFCTFKPKTLPYVPFLFLSSIAILVLA